MNEAVKRAKAEEIVRTVRRMIEDWCAVRTSKKKGEERVESLTREIVAVMGDQGFDANGEPRRVLGTFDLTADGCIALEESEVFHPESIGNKGLTVKKGWVDVPTKIGRDSFVSESFSAPVSSCYSTLAGAREARP